MIPQQGTTITLRALQGEPLSDERIREIVLATASAIAERQGVRIIDLQSKSDRVTATLAAGRIEALGFAAELRRLTTTWYTKKYGEPTLWGESVDEGEEWKLR